MNQAHPAVFRDYGSAGRAGVAVPQANPTVEPEMSVLLPRGVSLLATRLVSAEADQRTRFTGYIEDLGTTLKSYDTLGLDVLGFACTASSYLVGAARERAIVAALSEQLGYPIVTGGQAILGALRQLGVSKVAVIAPYPQFVLGAGSAYLEAAGIVATVKHRVVTRTTDTRSIYELGSGDAQAAAEAMELSGAECVLLTGTGMPSLRAVDALGDTLGVPVLSTNMCLAWAMAQTIGAALPDGPHPLINGWQERMDWL